MYLLFTLPEHFCAGSVIFFTEDNHLFDFEYMVTILKSLIIKSPRVVAGL
ncbi:hypothetical protein KKHLCK_04410 [Candidatus Electrothrix laxa]